MIRVDRNLQEKLPDSHLAWQPNDSNFIQHLDSKDQQLLRPPSPADPARDRSSSLSPAPESNSPHTQPETLSSPPLPPAAEEREEPVKVPQREEEEEDESRVEKASRLSTPLSDLPPTPDDLDAAEDPLAHLNTGNESKTSAEDQKKGAASDSSTVAETGKTTNDIGPHLSLPADKKPPDGLLNGPTALPADGSATKSIEYKIVTILELNFELVKVCVEFQKKGVPPTDALFYQFSQRLQSNLGWLAAIVDQSRQATQISLPLVEPPPNVDSSSNERIHQLYFEMSGFFAKEIARRQQLGIPLTIPGSGIIQGLNPPQKRERTDDGLPDPASKRQNTGEAKLSPSQMMPPPSSIPNIAASTPAANTTVLPGTLAQSANTNTFSLPMSNGITGPSPPAGNPQQFVQLSAEGNASGAQPNMLQQPLTHQQEAQLAASARARQAQMRAAQQQQAVTNAKHMATSIASARSMSPQGVGQPMGTNTGVSGGANQMNQGTGNVNASAGHSQILAQQAFQIMQNPNHPIMQHLTRSIPGFQTLPQQVQMQKIAAAAMAMQNRNQQQSDQQRAMAAGMQNIQQGTPMQNNTGGMSFPMANVNPTQLAGMGLGQQNNVLPAGIQGSNAGAMAGAGGMPAVNLNNLNPQQRQQFMLMQQQRGGGAVNMGLGNVGLNAGVGAGANGAAGSGMAMNPQQMALSQQQQQQQQRVGGGIGVGMGSPMLGGSNDFVPNMRPNNSIPGIARSTRSPSNRSPSPITPRLGNTGGRGASMGPPDDYQRMMIKQQQQQGQNSQAAAMFGSSGNTGAAQGTGNMAGNWAGTGQQGGIGMGGQGQMQSQNPQLHGMQGIHGIQNMQGMQGMQNAQNMQGIQIQGGYGMSSPTQPQHHPQQHQQPHSAAAGNLGGTPFLGGGLSSSPPPMGLSSPSWGGSPTQQQSPQGGLNTGMGGMGGGIFSPFSPTGGNFGDLSGHMAQLQASLAGTQDDYGALFDWTAS